MQWMVPWRRMGLNEGLTEAFEGFFPSYDREKVPGSAKQDTIVLFSH